jgi:hypothetical protein
LVTLFHDKSCALILSKKWVEPHFGHFFTNSSGHPGLDVGKGQLKSFEMYELINCH